MIKLPPGAEVHNGTLSWQAFTEVWPPCWREAGTESGRACAGSGGGVLYGIWLGESPRCHRYEFAAAA